MRVGRCLRFVAALFCILVCLFVGVLILENDNAATLNGIENPLETIRDTERDRLKTYSPLLITHQ